MPEPASDACHPDDLREVSGRLGCAHGYGSITQVTGSFGFAAAALATLGHYTLTQAFRAADITVTQPIQFLQLVWATILGLAVFGEQPEIWTWVGGGMIVASATFIAHREGKRRKDRDAPI